MRNRFGIRLEDKNKWERRAALTPSDVAALVKQGVDIWVERFPRRAFSEEDYSKAGAAIVDDVSPCQIVLGIKEMPVDYFRPGGAYMFFSHTVKGQPYNMKMLAGLVERKCTLFDYETVVDHQKKRLIFFGRYAGLAGMIDTLWALGQRLKALGYSTGFLDLKPTHEYADLDDAKAAVSKIGARIASEGLPLEISPFVVGFTGYGNVSQGAQEIFDLLPFVQIEPDRVKSFTARKKKLSNKLAKVVYREEHMVEPNDPSKPFDLHEYYDHPERYCSIFEPHLKSLGAIVNGIFWTSRYPKLGDAEQLARLFKAGRRPRLLVVGDISCDVDGALACTVKDTEPGDPVYIYDPLTRQARSGFDGPGLAVMAVGNLPAELPREASMAFSTALTPFVAAMAQADLTTAFDRVNLPDPIRRSAILWQGKFTPDYEYMRDFLR